ncbi:type II toxin-antitoxin system RelE/ParE family toxin [Gordonia malaquae]|uniref:type II toxin-antitoxin system RelE/ParE family toxin n=1 Tax=Gordonia malaquae TaxID=410332 RepID=UPI00301AC087
MWNIILLDDVEQWLLEQDDDAYATIAAAIEMLADKGPSLGRPFVDLVKGGKYKNLKELRPRGSNIRILFIFDPTQTAVLLVAGDKHGQWNNWYKGAMKEAERKYGSWLDEL